MSRLTTHRKLNNLSNVPENQYKITVRLSYDGKVAKITAVEFIFKTRAVGGVVYNPGYVIADSSLDETLASETTYDSLI